MSIPCYVVLPDKKKDAHTLHFKNIMVVTYVSLVPSIIWCSYLPRFHCRNVPTLIVTSLSLEVCLTFLLPLLIFFWRTERKGNQICPYLAMFPIRLRHFISSYSVSLFDIYHRITESFQLKKASKIIESNL